ncbi:hypothetical protein J4401_04765, partial [Candidatus Woesearchaeota archaeon]|nr:hypothetical protein [Candidatus Woesearchaeota archaeon]
FINYTNLIDGIYSFNATAKDGNNNINSTGTRTVTIDTTLPTIQFVFPTDTNNSVFSRNYTLVNVTATDTNFANITIYFFNSSRNLLNTTNISASPFFVNFSNLNEGTYYFNATAKDKANNINSTETRTVIMDIAPPTINFVSPSEPNNSVITRPNIAVNVTASDANLKNITIFLYNSSGLRNLTITLTSPNYVNFTELSDDVYYINATAIDTGNSINATETRIVRVDTLIPTINLVYPTRGNNSFVNVQDISVNVTSIDSSMDNITIYFFNSSGLRNQTFIATSPSFVNFTNLIEGIYRFNATAFDMANRSNSTATRTITIDLTIPTISFASQTDGNASFFTRNYIVVNVSGSDTNFGNITIYLSNSSGLMNATNISSSVNYVNFTDLINGIYYINATILDRANNENSTEARTITLDSINPTIAFESITNPNNTILASNYIVINVTSNDTNLANVTIYLFNSAGYRNESFSATSPNYINFTNLPDGTYYFNATAKDRANNTASTVTRIVTVDTTTPGITFISPTEANYSYLSRNYIAVNISSIDANLKNISIHFFNSSNKLNETNISVSPLFSNFTDLINGVYYINATVFDFTNKTNRTVTRIVTLDTVIPTIAFEAITESNQSILIRNYITVNVTGNDTNFGNITIYLYNSTGLRNSTNLSTSPHYINYTDLIDGVYYINATILDKANNMNATLTRTVTVDITNPTINFTSPTKANNSFVNVNYIAVNVSSIDANLRNITIFLHNSTGIRNDSISVTSPNFVNFTDLVEGTYTFNATAYDTANHTNSTETRIITVDFHAPYGITLLSPTPINNSAGNDLVTFNWTVQDNMDINLSCYPVANNVEYTLAYSVNGSNTSVQVTLLGGPNNISVRCYDNANNSNSSETRQYTVGLINITAPLEDSIVRPSNNISINVSIIFGTNYFNNITIEVNNLTDINELFMSNYSLNNYSVSYIVVNSSPRILTLTATAFNSASGRGINISDSIQVKLTRPSGTIATPVIEKACSNETFTFNNTNLTIATRFDLDTLLSSVNVTVSGPDGSNEALLQIRNFTDLNGSNNYTSYFNYSFKPNVSGVYNFTVRVMDIENNTINVTSTIMVSTGTKTFNISGIGISDIKLLDTCSGDIIQSGSAVQRTSPLEALYDINITAIDEPKAVSFANVNLSNFNTTNAVNYTELANETAPPSGQSRRVLWDLTSNLTYVNYTLIYNYSGIVSGISDESQIRLYKCSNPASCTLEQQTIVLDTANNIIRFSGTNLSRFMITEPKETVTVSTTTTTTSAGGGGGGGGSASTATQTKRVSFAIIPSTPLTMYSKDNITAKLSIVNMGDTKFTTISMTMAPNTSDLSVIPDKATVNDLGIEQAKTVNLMIESHTDPGIYEVDITGISENPPFTAKSKIIVKLVEIGMESDRKSIVEKIKFAQDLFKENPECLEFQELVSEAETALENEEYEKAAGYVDAAINACRDTITSLKGELRSPIKIDYVKIILGIIAVVAVTWLIADLYFGRNRRKSKSKKE